MTDKTDPNVPSTSSPWREWALWWLAGVLLGLPGLTQGAWLEANYDEWFVLQTALRLPQQGFNPQRFDWPSLVFYWQAGVSAAVYALGRMGGSFHHLQDFTLWYYQRPETLMVISRAVLLGLSALCLPATHWLARGLPANSRRVLVVLFALLPLRLNFANALLPEGPMLLLQVLGLGLLLGPAPPGRGACALAGLLLGLATGAKYPAAFALPFAAALVVGAGGLNAVALTNIGLMALASMAGFLISTPFALLDPATFWHWMKWQWTHTQQTGHPGLSQGSGPWAVGREAAAGLGLFVLPALLSFAGACASRRWRWAGAATLLLVIYFARLEVFFGKYLLALVPLLLALVVVWWRQATWPPWPPALGAVMAATMLLLAIPQLAHKTRRLPRQQAVDWLQRHTPPHSRIALDVYLPEPPLDQAAMRDRLREEPDNNRLKTLLAQKPPNGWYARRLPLKFWRREENLVRWLKDGRFRYLVVFAPSLGRLRDKDQQVRWLFAHLAQQGRRVVSFGGGEVVIYRLTPSFGQP